MTGELLWRFPRSRDSNAGYGVGCGANGGQAGLQQSLGPLILRDRAYDHA